MPLGFEESRYMNTFALAYWNPSREDFRFSRKRQLLLHLLLVWLVKVFIRTLCFGIRGACGWTWEGIVSEASLASSVFSALSEAQTSRGWPLTRTGLRPSPKCRPGTNRDDREQLDFDSEGCGEADLARELGHRRLCGQGASTDLEGCPGSKRKGDDLWALWLLLLLVLSFFNPRAYLSPSSTLFTRKEAFCFLSVPWLSRRPGPSVPQGQGPQACASGGIPHPSASRGHLRSQSLRLMEWSPRPTAATCHLPQVQPFHPVPCYPVKYGGVGSRSRDPGNLSDFPWGQSADSQYLDRSPSATADWGCDESGCNPASGAQSPAPHLQSAWENWSWWGV